MVTSRPPGSRRIPRLPDKQAPLSSSQRSIWLFEKWSPGTPVFNRPANLRLIGELNVDALQLALNVIINRHEILNVRFAEVDNQPVQSVRGPTALSLDVIDLRTWPDRAFETERFIHNEALVAFDLSTGPLFRAKLVRLSDTEHLLLFTFHHIVFDAWSMNVLLRDLRDAYRAYVSGKVPEFPPLPIQYLDFARWQQERLEAGAFETALNYWRETLRDIVPTVELPRNYSARRASTFNGASHEINLSQQLTETLRTVGHQKGATLFMTVLTVLQILLYRYSGQPDFSIGFLIAGRTKAETDDLIGCFINTLVFRAKVSPTSSFYDLLERTKRSAAEGYRHQQLPFDELVKYLQPDRTKCGTPFFQVVLNYRNRPPAVMDAGQLKIEPLASPTTVAVDDLTLDVSEKPEGLRCLFQYHTDIFEADTIKRISDHFQLLLETIVRNPAECISRIPILPAAERKQTIIEWNETRRDFQNPHYLHHLFEAQALRTPEAVAVIFGDQRITYAQLNRRANRLAHRLNSLGVGPETPVAVCAKPSLNMVVGLIGVLKAGGVYVPIDPSYPASRLEFLFRDLEPGLMLTEQSLRDQLPPGKAQVITLGECEEADIESENPNVVVHKKNAAYVIYTSGSTGDPKGVVITHEGVCNRLLAGLALHPFGEGDRILQITSTSFDVSLYEVFILLVSGGCLVIPPTNEARDPASLVRLIRGNGITVLTFTPAMLQLLLEEDGIEQCQSLRHVHCGGEAFPNGLQEKFFAKLPATLTNDYGPTECSIDTTQFRCVPGVEVERMPIGRPLPNVQVHVVDSNLEPVPIGVWGELYIGGVGLARCYLNHPGFTAERFLPNPFSPEAGERMYQTGDKVRFRSDGNLEFLGRVDKQIKIRGVRIEPGEIEAVLVRHPAIRDVVVTTCANPQGGELLAAFYSVSDTESITSQEVREFAQSLLPEALIPSIFVPVLFFALTPNGKIDVSALPTPDFTIQTPFVAARNEKERMLVDTWSDLFGRERISIHDNFFDLGGHSLMGVKLVAMMKDRLGVTLPMRVLFEAPTIALLAAKLSQGETGILGGVYPPALVPIQPSGKQGPLFFLMASGEEAALLSYSKLFRHVGRDRPTIGILPPRIGSNGRPFDVRGMAAECVSQIRAFKPDGPYRLVGYCAGGIIIFEIGQQLRQLGQDVNMFLIDTFYPIRVPEHLAPLNRRIVAHYAGRIQHHLRVLKKIPYGERFGYLTGRARAIGNLVEERGADDDAYLREIGHYRPLPYNQSITLLVTDDVYQVDPAMGWREFAKGGLEIIKIPGNHLTCMREDAHSTAQQLERCLAQRQKHGFSLRNSVISSITT